jgi:hypothetical protein
MILLKNFNTSHVSVQDALCSLLQYQVIYFNTSHVSVQELFPSILISTVAEFQYITCIGSRTSFDVVCFVSSK